MNDKTTKIIITTYFIKFKRWTNACHSTLSNEKRLRTLPAYYFTAYTNLNDKANPATLSLSACSFEARRKAPLCYPDPYNSWYLRPIITDVEIPDRVVSLSMARFVPPHFSSFRISALFWGIIWKGFFMRGRSEERFSACNYHNWACKEF